MKEKGENNGRLIAVGGRIDAESKMRNETTAKI